MSANTCVLLKIVLITVFSLSPLHARSSPDSTHYDAVVVEFAADGVVFKDPPQEIISRNWAEYNRLIAEAEGADIIVFPECGLTTPSLPVDRRSLRGFTSRVPDPASRPAPCDSPRDAEDTGEVVRNASCAARRHGIYVVVNLPEELPCTGQSGCPSDGVFIYNTNLAFDRTGALVAKYHKFHLFGEAGFNTPPTPELAVFETDFGARFGTFICFDILFEGPPERLVKDRGVTDVAYPTAWFSQLPFLTAVQTQAGWAHANNVTLLAAGFDRPSMGNTGSGVYWGDGGALGETMREQRGTQVVRVRVPKRSLRTPPATEPAPAPAPAPQHHRLPLPPPAEKLSIVGRLKLKQDELRMWSTVLLPPAGGAFETTLCYGPSLCCRVEMDADASPSHPDAAPTYFYRFGVYDGVHAYAHLVAAGVQSCAVFACLNTESLSSCGLVEEGRAPGLAFKRLVLTGDGFKRHHALQMPSTVQASLLPLDDAHFRFSVRKSKAAGATNRFAMELTQPPNASQLLTFGVYGRVYDRDRPFHDALPPSQVSAAVDAASPRAADDSYCNMVN